MSNDPFDKQPGESDDAYMERIMTTFREQVDHPERAAYEALRELYDGLTQKGRFARTEALYVLGVYLATAATMQDFDPEGD